jgi:hypothetical protein
MNSLELKWELVTDHVMGGVSNGRMEQTLVKGQAATRMTGRVSLDNNGGFIQIAADLPPPPPSAKGVALHLIGNAETYNIHRACRMDTWSFRVRRFPGPSHRQATATGKHSAHRHRCDWSRIRCRCGGIFGWLLLDQDEFWLIQPKLINLIAFKVIEQLYGFT